MSYLNETDYQRFFPRRYHDDNLGIIEILYNGLCNNPSRTPLNFEGNSQTLQETALSVGAYQNWLADHGLKPESRVALMLDNHLSHVALIYALILSGIVWVPINTKLRRAGLQHILNHSKPDLVITENDTLRDIAVASYSSLDRSDAIVKLDEIPINLNSNTFPKSISIDPDCVLCIIYTSGTTGPPKGVLFTHRMMRIAGEGLIKLADIKSGDRLFLWEPLYHIGGSQVLIVPFLEDVEMHIVERFSASRFWDQVQTSQATHLHYLGGILDILVQKSSDELSPAHNLRVAWGAGVSEKAWKGIVERFGFQLRECYGMTECSSFTTINTNGKPGSIGRPLPWLDLQLLDNEDKPVPVGEVGQIVLSSKVNGTFLPCYLNDEEATHKALRNGKFYTGDLARQDSDGDFFFVGRTSDSIRVRGENVSAWEVERIFALHPSVAASAAIGIEADIGEQDIKLFVQFRRDMRVSFEELSKWAALHLTSYQLPTYYKEIDSFDFTPSKRIRKHLLSRAKDDDCWKRNS